jgi:hypothetical protein
MTVAKKSVRSGGLRERMAHLGMGLFTNLLIIPLLLGVYFFGEPKYKLVAGIGVLLGSETLVIIATRLRRTWKTMKPLGYFLAPGAKRPQAESGGEDRAPQRAHGGLA